MANIVIGYDDKVSGGTITAGHARAGLPGANVGTAQPGQVWRTPAATTTSHLLVDLGASYSISSVFLGTTNLTAAATWRVRFSTADATGVAGNSHDSTTIAAGVDPIFGSALRVFSSPATGRYVRVDLVDASLPYLEAGILRAGPAFRPAKNYEMGAKLLHRDFSRGRLGWDGSQWLLRGSQQRGVELRLPAVTTAEWETHGEPLIRMSGTSRDVWVCLDTAASNVGRETFFGLMDEVPAWERALIGHVTTAFRVWHRI